MPVRPWQARPQRLKEKTLVFAIQVSRLVFRVAGLVLPFFYKLFFSWWLKPFLDQWFRNRFADELRLRIPFLFDLYGAKVVRDPRRETNSSAVGYVCLAAGGIILKFRSWRDEAYGTQISPAFAPSDFCELLDALKAVDPAVDTELAALEFRWGAWGKLLEPRFHLLQHAFSKRQFAETKMKLATLRAVG